MVKEHHSQQNLPKPGDFTPALGRTALTGSYDWAIRLLTRERRWRGALLRQLAPCDGEAILDVGCGTGTFAIMLKRASPGARVVGIDPDPQILSIASDKAKQAGVDIEWQQGFAHEAGRFAGTFDKVVSSLVFHQVPIAGKQEGLAAMFAAARPGGEVHIADYARQHSWLMRRLFRATVQRIDGRADTQPNADGALEAILASLAGAEGAQPNLVVPTPTGAISLFRAIKPAGE